MSQKLEVVWKPQAGPQEALIHCPVEEILFGGARGGGKTDAALGLVGIKGEKYGKGSKAVFFRRELTQLDAVIARSQEIFKPIGWEYKEFNKQWTAPNGATCKFRHLERDSDAEKYQGHDYSTLIFEELTNFPSPTPIMKLKGTLRSARGVPCQMIATANPGGPGHLWVKRRYIDPAPMGWKIIQQLDKFSGKTLERVYIPSRLTDNKILTDNDPNYIARLAQTGSEQLVKAWLHGLWDVVDGAFFDGWDSGKHVLRTGAVPEHWNRFRCGDWGSARPAAFYWGAIASEPWISPCGKLVPKNAIVYYNELYTVAFDENGDFVPNKGTKTYAEEVGRQLAALEQGMPPVQYGVIDPSATSNDGGPSIAERIYRGSGGKVMFRPADNKRVPGRGALGGWDQMRARLAGEDIGDGTIRPMVYFMDTCIHAIRTIPMMQHDPDNLEDMDTEGEDHACDAIRYGLMSRPYAAPGKEPRRAARGIEEMRMDELWAHHAQQLESGRNQGFAGRI